MATQKELIPLVNKMRSQGKSGQEIAEELNGQGMKSPSGKKFKANTIYTLVSVGKRTGYSKKKNRMIEIPVEEGSAHGGKIIAVIANLDDVQKLIKGWIS